MPRRPPRFFVDSPLAPGEVVTLSAEQARQIGAVLRLRPGGQLILFNGDGQNYPARLSALDRLQAAAAIEGAEPAPAYPPPAITLALAPIKAERFDWAVQKATELGVAAVVPLATERTVVSFQTGRVGHRVERWRRIAVEAAEQCGRATLPCIEEPQPFESAVRLAAKGPAILLWEDERRTPLAALPFTALPSLWLLVGPEGGFSAAEVALARAAGLTLATLGPLILRAETAAIAAVATVRALTVTKTMIDTGTDTEGSCAS
ncbi:MAG TPA: 16S rRNA (uracil(1498)-N(3))-methyltransferase [Thermomicrobiaceae bacterium]|nr:16S rRNA (uracil(1498)-N(3))-methyltransferase [Thermomicrobiaceae bacterium]